MKLSAIEPFPVIPVAIRRLDNHSVLPLAIAGLLGLAFVFLMPPFQFNDEHAQFARAYQISHGEVVIHGEPQIPSAILAVLLQFPEGFKYKSTSRPTFAGLLEKSSDDFSTPVAIQDGSGLNYLKWGNVSYQVYWPVCYFPASSGIRIARYFQLSTISMLYSARLANLICFLIAFALALLLTSDFRALIVGLVLMPMTLQQSVAVSADSVTIGISLIGFALILRTRQQAVGRGYLGTVLAVVPIWAMCKNSVWALPLLLLIPASQFKGRSQRAAFILAAICLTVGLGVLWKDLDSDSWARFAAMRMSLGINIAANVMTFVSHPWVMWHDLVLASGALGTFSRLLHEFVGTFGWAFHHLPGSLPYAVMLVTVAYLERSSKPFSTAERVILFLVFTAALIQSYFTLFAIEGLYRNGHFSFGTTGVQGRYLIPYSLAGLLAFNQKSISVSSHQLIRVVLALSTLMALVTIKVIVDYFYV